MLYNWRKELLGSLYYFDKIIEKVEVIFTDIVVVFKGVSHDLSTELLPIRYYGFYFSEDFVYDVDKMDLSMCINEVC